MHLAIPIGLVLVLLSLVLAGRHWLIRRAAVRAIGKVVRVAAGQAGAGNAGPTSGARSTIQFADANGMIRLFHVEETEPRKPGESVSILYPQADPSKAQIDDVAIWVRPLVIGVLGLVMMGYGLLR